jgi:hypothetical protein
VTGSPALKLPNVDSCAPPPTQDWLSSKQLSSRGPFGPPQNPSPTDSCESNVVPQLLNVTHVCAAGVHVKTDSGPPPPPQGLFTWFAPDTLPWIWMRPEAGIWIGAAQVPAPRVHGAHGTQTNVTSRATSPVVCALPSQPCTPTVPHERFTSSVPPTSSCTPNV